MVFDIQGLVAPVFTPFHADGTLNLAVIPSYLDYLVNNNIHGILVGGTTGEFICLSLDERLEVLKAWLAVRQNYASVRIIAQVGGVPLPEVLTMAKNAYSLGVDAIMTLPEIYYKPKTSEQLVSYLETVSAAANDIPLIFYHFPMMSGVELNIPEFFKLASSRISNFKAMKADLDVAMQVEGLMKEDQRIFIGNHNVAPATFLGHESSIATITNLMPKLMNDTVEASRLGAIKKARKCQETLNRIVTTITSEGDFLPAMKVAMQHLSGIEVGPPRAPLIPLNSNRQRILKEKLSQLNI